MRKPFKLLSVLLAMVMIFSSVAVGANAAYSAYKDAALGTNFDSIDKAVFTTQQLSSIALDEVDRMLYAMDEEDKVIVIPVVNATLNLSSVDSALNSLQTIYDGSAWTAVKSILGDLGNLNWSALRPTRRTTAGKYDYDVIYCLFQFLYDNKAILVSYADKTLNIGTGISSLVGDSLDDFLDLPKLAKSLIYEQAYKVKPNDTQLASANLDVMVQDLIDKLLDEGEISLNKSLKYGLSISFDSPSDPTKNFVDIDNGSVYDLIETALQRYYNDLGVPVINTYAKLALRKLADVKYTTEPVTAADIDGGDESKTNIGAEFLNIDYVVPTHTFAPGDRIVDQFNNILGEVVNAMVLLPAGSTLTWQMGGNNLLITNLTNYIKEFLVNESMRNLLSDYVNLPTVEEINAMTLEELLVYLAKDILYRYLDYIVIPDDATTLRGVASYALLEFAAERVPSLDIRAKFAAGTYDYNNTNNGLLAIGSVLAVYYANAYTNMNLPYVDGNNNIIAFDATLASALTWALNNYGSILSFTSGITGVTATNVWAKLNEVIFGLIPATWLPAGKADVHTILFDSIIDAVFDLDPTPVLALLQRNTDASAELSKTTTVALINFVQKILNAVISGAIPGTFANFESILNYTALGNIVNGLVTGLYNRKVGLLTGALPIVCQVLDLTAEQELKESTIKIPQYIISATNNVTGKSISIRNETQGVNTGYTDTNGVKHRDDLYKYRIVSIAVSGANKGDVAVTYTANQEINGGTTVVFPITGNTTADTLLKFTITYNILDESGTNLTSSPISTDAYTYVSTTNPQNNYEFLTGIIGTAHASYNSISLKSTTASFIGSSDGWSGLKGEYGYVARQATVSPDHTIPANVTQTSFAATQGGNPVSWLISAYPTTGVPTTMQGNNTIVYLYNTELPEEVPALDEEGNPILDPETQLPTTRGPRFSDYYGTYLTTHVLNAPATSDMYPDQIGTITLNRTVVLFDDFNLESMVERCLTANRQQSNYATSGTFEYTVTTPSLVEGEDPTVETFTVNAATAWSNYVAALDAAATLVKKPLTVSNFNAAAYETASALLELRTKELEACAVAAGIAPLEASYDAKTPDNEKDAVYTDAGYHFFGSEDYLLYTYERFNSYKRNASRLINSQYVQLEEPAENATPEEIAAYEEAYAKAEAAIPTLKAFDITYAQHMYDLTYARLRPVAASTTYLKYAIDDVEDWTIGYVAEDYTVKSWTALQTAMAFAENIYNNRTDPTLRQSKVNEARRGLIAAYKGLLLAALAAADYVQLDTAITAAQVYTNNPNLADIYQQSAITALTTALANAQNCSRDLLLEDQTTIDNLATALNQAVTNLLTAVIPATITPLLSGETGLGWDTVLDTDNNLAYGFDFSLSDLASFFTATGGATFTVSMFDGSSVGTGSQVIVRDRNNNVVANYTVVIFGDNTGDALCDPSDVMNINSYINGDTVEEDYTEAQMKANDCYSDGVADPSDLMILNGFVNGDVMELSQNPTA